ncbi:MAG: enoyl-CoA hydratase/isomerase family protein [Gammaproteobacteria bacterium]|nr:enoyl-CoA hydratase/isomerase family protein [Gammaproteobacteria bacterium]
MSELVTLERQGHVGLLLIDNPPVNAFTRELREQLREAIQAFAADPQMLAGVLACEGNTFIAGADLKEFDTGIAAPLLRDLLDEIEALDKPIVAALHGNALGGGVETALACHARVALKGTRLAFPEITLGIVPGAGGTQRLPRLIGIPASLDLMLSGRMVPADEALELGLVDKVVESELRQAAATRAMELAAMGHEHLRASARELPGDVPSAEYFEQQRQAAAERYPNRTVPGSIVDAIAAAGSHTLADGIAYEARLSDDSLATVESRALRHLFFAERQTAEVPGLDAGISPRPITSVGIIGGGTMGRGIAMAFANAGIAARLIDVSAEAAAKAMAEIRRTYESRVKRQRMTAEVMESTLSLISGAGSMQELSDADLVIEAVFENMALKQEIFQELDQICKPGAMLATNTSTLDINKIAAVTSRPADVLGLHFFSPAHVMRLLEIVRTDQTADEVIRSAFEMARRIRKTAVLAGVCHGFIGNRIMDPYGREAERMLLEGASVEQVDGVLQRFGWAMGILAVYDLAGVDVGVKIREERRDSLPDDPSYYLPSKLLADQGWLGQKSGRGFYNYDPETRSRTPNPEAETMFRRAADELGIPQRELSDEEILNRCMYALINEAARVLEDGIALRAADIDVVYTNGYGFPRYRGGPMFHADQIGLAKIVSGIEAFSQQLDPQYWQVSALLRSLAESGGSFADRDRGKG